MYFNILTEIKISNNALTSSFKSLDDFFSSEESNKSLNVSQNSIKGFEKSFDKYEEGKLDLCRKTNEVNNEYYDDFYNLY